MSEFKTQNQFEKLKKRKEYLVFLILLFVIVIIWVGASIFSSQQKLGVSPADKKLAQPIKPSLNDQVLGILEQKRIYSDRELLDFPVLAEIENDDGKIFLMDVRQAKELIKEKEEILRQEEELRELKAEQAVLDLEN